MKPLRPGNEEGKSKYTLLGQRLEKPALQTFWDYLKDNNVTEGNTEYQTLFSPGLVQKTKKPYVRDSSDGVLLQKVNGVKEAVPVEIKARVTPNTFHRTIARFNRKHGSSDMPGLGEDASQAKYYTINDDDEILLALIPEHHDLLQILNHAYTYGTNSCYYVICSHAALLYVLKVNFSDDLLDAYKDVTDWFYTETLTPFYAKNFEVPEMPEKFKQALKDKRFAHLKMTEHTFQSYVGLWRVVNIHHTKAIKFPLPPIARGVPATVAKWNTIKGGGDTLTKMADFCQERISVCSDVLIACSRFLLNAGLVFHRSNKMCSEKDPEDYPTLYHICNTNNKRFSSKD